LVKREQYRVIIIFITLTLVYSMSVASLSNRDIVAILIDVIHDSERISDTNCKIVTMNELLSTALIYIPFVCLQALEAEGDGQVNLETSEGSQCEEHG
jgi:hypothetical protein